MRSRTSTFRRQLRGCLVLLPLLLAPALVHAEQEAAEPPAGSRLDLSRLTILGTPLEDALFPGFERSREPTSRRGNEARLAALLRRYPTTALQAADPARARPVSHRDNLLRVRF